MASCYKCGVSGASNRRTVSTGFSIGNWVSKRSYGASTRSYFGLRTVCDDCAASIDKWSNIKWALIFATVGIILLMKILS